MTHTHSDETIFGSGRKHTLALIYWGRVVCVDLEGVGGWGVVFGMGGAPPVNSLACTYTHTPNLYSPPLSLSFSVYLYISLIIFSPLILYTQNSACFVYLYVWLFYSSPALIQDEYFYTEIAFTFPKG